MPHLALASPFMLVFIAKVAALEAFACLTVVKPADTLIEDRFEL
jgi:hypothetical protein